MELEKEFKNYIKNDKFSNTGMKCHNCHNYINSYHHSQNCMIVNMYETKIQTIDVNFKNMMTYGLGGCTAGFVVYKEEDNIMIWMCHHPDKMRFKIEMFKILSTHTNNIIRVMIRSKGEYVKNEGDKYFKEKVIDNDMYVELLDFFKCPYSLEPYFDCQKESQSFYIKYENNNLYYTNTFGNYEKINLCF